MKCEYSNIDYSIDGAYGEMSHWKQCQNEDARYYCCDIVDAIVCKEHVCRCWKSMQPLTDDEIKEHMESRTERRKRVDRKK
jgi:hypothetical protein